MRASEHRSRRSLTDLAFLPRPRPKRARNQKQKKERNPTALRQAEARMKSYENPMGDESSLQRVGTMSSKHELLKQIRDAVNPNQRKQNILLMAQAAL